MSCIDKLKHKITIQSKTSTINDYGAYSNTWAALATVWSSKGYDTGYERLKADQLDSTVAFKFVIRHRTDVTAAMRILLDSEYYTIQQVYDLDGDKRWTTIRAILETDGAQAT